MRIFSFIDKKIHRALDATTMYRVVEYALGILAGYAIILSFFHILPYNGFFLLLSLGLLVSVCHIVNALCSFITKRPEHPESAVITGLILFFLFSPLATVSDALFLALAAALAMASKYIFAYHGRQISNPAAFSAVIFGLFGNPAIWWVGSAGMLPAVSIVALCILKKMRRWNLFFLTVCASFIPVSILALKNNTSLLTVFTQHITSWPIVFFVSVMVTEPLTLPPIKKFQMIYGVIVGILSSIPFHIGLLYSSPELALVFGNIYSYIVSMKKRISFRLKEKIYIAKDVCELIFQPNNAFLFSPGQYMEWTLPHEHPDVRGIRRYFTLASSPTENNVHVGVRFSAPSSSFKKKLHLLEQGDTVWAAQLCGDFVLPKQIGQKLGFIAGGIGITPFRSMIKYCIDIQRKCDAVLFYVNKTPEDIAYISLLNDVSTRGIRTVYCVDTVGTTAEWKVETGFLTPQVIEKYIQDTQERLWYISGPNAMVETYKKLLRDMGVKKKNIKTDYFSGYA